MTLGTVDAPATIGLVADDFTGAADSAGVFAQHGWSVHLLTGAASDDRENAVGANTVLAIATGSRSMSYADAAEVTARAVDRLAAAGVERLFVKIDSTMRGPVAAQVKGAMDAWGSGHANPRALACPAFPAQGRTVVDGVVFVEGIAVRETASGRDPFAPVASSHLAELLPEFLPTLATRDVSPMPPRSYVDATTDADLDAVAHLVAQDPAVVAVGSAGLASALARRWECPARARLNHAVDGDVVVAVSSLHPVSARQLSELAASAHTGTTVLAPPAERHPSAAQVAGELAERVSAAMRARRVGSLIVVGGDGLAAILADLGATGVDIDGVLEAGCPTGTIVGGAAHGVRVVSKSGGFGSPSALVDLVSRLRSIPPARDPLTHSAHLKEDHHD